MDYIAVPGFVLFAFQPYGSLPSRFGVLIRDGIEPGEWLVTAGVHSLEEGRKVRILDEAAKR